jgi:hypothetical protein
MKNLLSLPRMEPRFLGRPNRSLVDMLTEVGRKTFQTEGLDVSPEYFLLESQTCVPSQLKSLVLCLNSFVLSLVSFMQTLFPYIYLLLSSCPVPSSVKSSLPLSLARFLVMLFCTSDPPPPTSHFACLTARPRCAYCFSASTKYVAIMPG